MDLLFGEQSGYKLKGQNSVNLFCPFVGAARFELATSTSQMWRDDRATLRPDAVFFRLRDAKVNY